MTPGPDSDARRLDARADSTWSDDSRSPRPATLQDHDHPDDVFVVAAIVVSIAAGLGVWWTVALIVTGLVVGPLIGLLMAGAARTAGTTRCPSACTTIPGIADRGPSDPASPQYDPAVDPNVPDDRR